MAAAAGRWRGRAAAAVARAAAAAGGPAARAPAYSIAGTQPTTLLRPGIVAHTWKTTHAPRLCTLAVASTPSTPSPPAPPLQLGDWPVQELRRALQRAEPAAVAAAYDRHLRGGANLAAVHTVVNDAVLFLCRSGQPYEAEKILEDWTAYSGHPLRPEWIRALVLAFGTAGQYVPALRWYEQLRRAGGSSGLGDATMVAFAMAAYLGAGQTAAVHALYNEAAAAGVALSAAVFRPALLAAKADRDGKLALRYFTDLKRLRLPLFLDMSDALFATVLDSEDHAAATTLYAELLAMSGKQYPMSRAVIVLMLNSYRRAGDLDGLLATLDHTAKVGVHVPAEAYNVALSACLDGRRSDRFAAVAASIPRGRHDIVTCNLLMVHEIRRQNLERANEFFQMAISIYGTRYRQTPELDRAMDYTVQTLLFAHRKERNWDRIRSLYEQFRRVRLPMSATVRLEALLAYARLSDSHGFAECRRSLRDEDFDLPQRGAFYLADLLMFSRTHNTAAAEAHWANMVWPALQALPAILEKVPSSWIAAANVYIDVLLSAERFEEAERLVTALDATRVKPDRVTAATVLLHYCNRLREDDALRWVQRYREITGPLNGWACAYMVHMYSRLGREDDVLVWYRRGVDVCPLDHREELGYLYGSTMRALVRCGQPAMALTIWNHALTSGGVLPKQAVTQFLNICDECGLVDQLKAAWKMLAGRRYDFAREHYQRYLDSMIHHGSLVDVATALRDIIVAEHVLPANTIDLETLNARLQAEARSARANAASRVRQLLSLAIGPDVQPDGKKSPLGASDDEVLRNVHHGSDFWRERELVSTAVSPSRPAALGAATGTSSQEKLRP